MSIIHHHISHNQKMVEVGRNLWRSSGALPLTLKHSHLWKTPQPPWTTCAIAQSFNASIQWKALHAGHLHFQEEKHYRIS